MVLSLRLAQFASQSLAFTTPTYYTHLLHSLTALIANTCAITTLLACFYSLFTILKVLYKREMDFGKYILGRLRFNRSLERIISEIGPSGD